MALLLAQITPGWTHDTWIEEGADRVSVLTGHQGEPEPYPPERVVSITGYTATGWAVPLDVEKKGEEKSFARIDEPFMAYTALLDNQYWLNTTTGWKNQRDKQDLSILMEGRSYKYAKHISQWADFLKKPLGQRFEIVPQQDPTKLKEGDKLSVKIYFEGKPVQGTKLSSNTDMKGDTHELNEVKGEGPFAVTLGPAGKQLVTAKYVLPVEGESKVVWFAGALTFTTAK
jgi:nickel transport protein